MNCTHKMGDTCPHGCHDMIDYEGEDWPDEEIGDGVTILTVRQCPVCDDSFEESGEAGIVPHILAEHDWSEQARRIRDLMKGGQA